MHLKRWGTSEMKYTCLSQANGFLKLHSTGLLTSALSPNSAQIPLLVDAPSQTMAWIFAPAFSAAIMPFKIRRLKILEGTEPLLANIAMGWWSGYESDEYINTRAWSACCVLHFSIVISSKDPSPKSRKPSKFRFLILRSVASRTVISSKHRTPCRANSGYASSSFENNLNKFSSNPHPVRELFRYLLIVLLCGKGKIWLDLKKL